MDTIISAVEQIVGLLYQFDWSDPACLDPLTLDDLASSSCDICINLTETPLKPSRYNYIVHTKSGYILYNTFFNSLSRLNQQEYDTFCSPECCSIRLKEQLVEQGFLLPQTIDELDVYYRLTSFLHHQITRPLKVVLAPTMECNARCFYCYEAGVTHGKMGQETIDQVVAWIADKAAQKGVDIVWFGGEPLLGVTCIDEISAKLTEKAIPFSSYMITNGSLLDDTSLPEQIKRWNLRHVQITIDGDESEYLKRKNYAAAIPNCYEKLMNHMETLAKNDVHVFIRLNIDRHNIMSIYQAASEIEHRFSEYSNVSFYPAFLTGSDAPLAEEDKIEVIRGILSRAKTVMGLSMKSKLYELPRISACDINNPNFFAIDSNGTVYSCEHDLGKKHLSIGSITNPTLNNERPIPGQRSECRACSFLPKCFGGCHSAYVNGDDPCFENKYMIKAYLELL